MPGRKYRRENQTGSRNDAMRRGKILGRRKLIPPSPAQTSEEAGCGLPAEKKSLSHVAKIDQNNGLIYVIRANKKPELMGQSAYNLW